MSLKELDIPIPAEFETVAPPEIEDRTSFTLELVDLWQETGSAARIWEAVTNYIQRYHGFGSINEARALKIVPEYIMNIFTDEFGLTRRHVFRISEFQENLPAIKDPLQQGNITARLLFSEPLSLEARRVIFYDSILWFFLSPYPASTDADRIIFDYPRHYQSLRSFLGTLNTNAAHEFVHVFRFQRHPVSEITIMERFIHEAFSSLISSGDLGRLDDGQVEEEIDFWLPLTLRYCLMDKLSPDKSLEILQAVEQLCPSWQKQTGSRASVARQVSMIGKNEGIDKQLEAVFHEESNIFYKVSRYFAAQVVSKGGIEAIRAVSGLPPMAMIEMYNQLSCLPLIPRNLVEAARRNS